MLGSQTAHPFVLFRRAHPLRFLSEAEDSE